MELKSERPYGAVRCLSRYGGNGGQGMIIRGVASGVCWPPVSRENLCTGAKLFFAGLSRFW